ncbi:hypothetical protein VTL71DRAFT_9538 [Oculimacula yallundae]|uniref:GA4 desaturase n=1 Tax=Oculimacula yallundae TaxID=86028 RepID=A0ABR4BS64_9HELO
MSTTTTTTSITTSSPVSGKLLYIEPEDPLNVDNRPFYGLPAVKHAEYQTLPLHDIRTDAALEGGPRLDIHGFTYKRHVSSLLGEEWFSKEDIAAKYLPEVEALLKSTTGAKKVAFIMVNFRRKSRTDPFAAPALTRENDPIDPTKTVTDKVLITSSAPDASNSPVGFVHIDYSRTGIRAVAGESRRDIEVVASDTLAAEAAALAAGVSLTSARYASYSVWRPLKTVKRDPLIVMDRRSVKVEDLVEVKFRVPNGRGEDRRGEFLAGACNVKPGNSYDKHMWYWLPEQTPEEVLILRSTDSAAPEDSCVGAPHTSAIIDGTEGSETRESIEVKAICFW